MSLYPSTVKIERRIGTGSDSTGHPIETLETLFDGIPASVQMNRATTGASGNHRFSRGALEQPNTTRIYTPTDVSTVKADDIVTHVQSGKKYQVLQAVNQADRGRSWRIEASNL